MHTMPRLPEVGMQSAEDRYTSHRKGEEPGMGGNTPHRKGEEPVISYSHREEVGLEIASH